jgi:hypothetical protein
MPLDKSPEVTRVVTTGATPGMTCSGGARAGGGVMMMMMMMMMMMLTVVTMTITDASG